MLLSFIFLLVALELQPSSSLQSNIPCMPSFNISLFAGTWYQQAKFGPMLFGGLDQCGLLKCDYNPKTDQMDLSYTSTSLLGLKQLHYSGRAKYLRSNKKDGVLVINWKFDPEYKQEAMTRLHVVDTNYDEFAVIAASKENKTISGWVMTRERNLLLAKDGFTILSKIIKVMEGIEGIVNEDVYLDSQIGCDTPKFHKVNIPSPYFYNAGD